MAEVRSPVRKVVLQIRAKFHTLFPYTALDTLRIRPNASYQSAPDSNKTSDLYRRFRNAFEAIVAVQNPAIARQEFGDWFVRVPPLEETLRESCMGELDSIRFLLGSTGIGKSTLLRYVFRTADVPRVDGDSLFIPFCFNSRLGENDFFNPIAAAASRIVMETFSISFQLNAFYDVIRTHRPHLLELDRSLPETATWEERLLALKRSSLLEYELEKLKFLVPKTPIVRVVLIVDDVEALPFGEQEHVIGTICKAYSFLQLQPERSFGVKGIISCRPNTHSLLRKRAWYPAYPFDQSIHISASVDLEKLFQARFEAATKKTSAGKDPANRPEWDRAYEILLKLVEQLSLRYELELTTLCNHNVRRALYEFGQLLANRRWFQRDQVVSPSFIIRESDYALNEVAVYRALALRNGEVYPGRDSIIANLLHNTPDEGSDLLVTYIIRYLLNQKSAGEEAGRSQIHTSRLRDDFSLLFDSVTDTSDVELCLTYMIDSKLLEVESVGGKDVISLTPKAETLWKMLQSNSICLEFFRDDTFQEVSDVAAGRLERHHPDQTFLSLLAFFDFIVAAEKRRVWNAISSNSLRAYLSRFGQQTLGRLLSFGIHHSIDRYYFRRGPGQAVVDALRASDAKVAEVESLIKGPH